MKKLDEKRVQIAVRASVEDRQKFKVICVQAGTTEQDVLHNYIQKVIQAGKVGK